MKYYAVVMTDFGEIEVGESVLKSYGIDPEKIPKKGKLVDKLVEVASAIAEHEYRMGRKCPRRLK